MSARIFLSCVQKPLGFENTARILILRGALPTSRGAQAVRPKHEVLYKPLICKSIASLIAQLPGICIDSLLEAREALMRERLEAVTDLT
jgi:hypothetical protein